ncbi:26S proteasome non-ATPase regulatory subunit [Malassezia vespertilionis]|uniref:Rpn3p n=1 Tax=Malassezia vespertilionis TaxID=2020962 RepID=A0A2N1J8W5_9BASI|nr:26S proteasome non-ATPase regulatory subunit [Malassezia vespertilionis]PKI82995.1 Rpn3p [Malassezia vespertilionis]WFD07814.1 26S proteasome non-ATPase regulatory subunit [Malassezia vespertilionis]
MPTSTGAMRGEKQAAPVPEQAAEHAQTQLLALLRHNLAMIRRSVAHVEQRYTARVLRSLPYVRRELKVYGDVLALVVSETLPDQGAHTALLNLMPPPYLPKTEAAVMDEDMPQEPAKTEDVPRRAEATQVMQALPETMPEITAYLSLLVTVYLLDQGSAEKAKALCEQAMDNAVRANRRSLDLLVAKLAFFLGRCYEVCQGGLVPLRDSLLALLRTASLRHDSETNATVQNLLLRFYIVESNLYDQAEKFVSRAPFPRAKASNAQVARYDYYVGRIRALQLNYSDARAHFQQAIRRAPQQGLLADALAAKEPNTNPLAAGFLQTAYKFLIIVELLMGDLPERSVFRIPLLRRALAVYLPIVQAVRAGNLALFQETLQKHQELFQRDKTYSLILRLRHNVIKTGIRRISLAYSRISLADITRKLRLESEEDAEYVIAKAIRDGVIDAMVEHDSAIMVSNEAADVYATNEPQAQLQQRINFCMQLHNDSVKAMRYSLESHRAELASATAALERERELANEIVDGDMDESDEEWP